MREQEEGGLQAAGRRGGVVRALLGLGAIAEGAAAAEGSAEEGGAGTAAARRGRRW